MRSELQGSLLRQERYYTFIAEIDVVYSPYITGSSIPSEDHQPKPFKNTEQYAGECTGNVSRKISVDRPVLATIPDLGGFPFLPLF
jgi:hypothetical protein